MISEVVSLKLLGILVGALRGLLGLALPRAGLVGSWGVLEGGAGNPFVIDVVVGCSGLHWLLSFHLEIREKALKTLR